MVIQKIYRQEIKISNLKKRTPSKGKHMSSRKLEVVAYQPSWQTMFAKEKQLLLAHLPNSNIVNIHHIGSTSVPELAAKPIIDILLEVHSLQELDEADHLFSQMNYEIKGENGIANRRYFQKGGDQRSHHLHAFAINDVNVSKHLAFRDYLRQFPAIKNAYQTLKQQAVLACNGDMEKYMAHKHDFIQQHTQEALIWWQEHPST